MNVMAAICNSFSGRHLFALLTRSPGLNERAPVEEADLLYQISWRQFSEGANGLRGAHPCSSVKESQATVSRRIQIHIF